MSHLARIADRVINRPLLLMPKKLGLIVEVLAGRIGIEAGADFGLRDPAAEAAVAGLPGASRFAGESYDRASGRAMPYRRTPEGVAIVTITGSLVNRGAWVGASSGLTSYEGIAFQIDSAARDPKVRSILLDMESPGGEAVGCFEVAATIRKVGAEKPIHAMVNGMAASAAYAIASACRSITSVESGLSGSIGVVMLHADYSRAIDRAGITPTFIHAGAHKVDGNPFEPLSKEVRGDLQAEVEKFYSLFLETVAAGRGKRLSAKAARATEARTFIGQAALDAGLVDQIGNFGELLAMMNRSAAKSSPRNTGGARMALDLRFFDMEAADPAPTATQPAPAYRAIAGEAAKEPAPAAADDWAEVAARIQGRRPDAETAALRSDADKVPQQKGAAAWSDIAAKLNAEARRARGAQRKEK